MTTVAREVDLSQPVLRMLENQGFNLRQEVVVTIPDHGRVTADIMGRKAGEFGDELIVVELKRRVDWILERQATRWLPYASMVSVGYIQAGRDHPSVQRRCERLAHMGIGRIVIGLSGTLIAKIHQPTFRRIDCSLLAEAFDSHDGSLDPAAGSAGAKRQTPARTEWEDVRRFILANPGCSFRELRHGVPGRANLPFGKLQRAIEDGMLMGVRISGTPAVFIPTHGETQ